MDKKYYSKLMKKILFSLLRDKNSIATLLFENMKNNKELCFCYYSFDDILIDIVFKKKETR